MGWREAGADRHAASRRSCEAWRSVDSGRPTALQLAHLLVGDPDRDMHVDELPGIVVPVEHGRRSGRDGQLPEVEGGLVRDPAHRALFVAFRMAGLDAEPLRLEPEPHAVTLGHPLAGRGADHYDGIGRNDFVEVRDIARGHPVVEAQHRVSNHIGWLHGTLLAFGRRDGSTACTEPSSSFGPGVTPLVTACLFLGVGAPPSILGVVGSSFERLVAEALVAPFTGWDLPWLRERAREEPPPWDYEARAVELLGSAIRALDIDTGGGEVLAAFAPFPGRVFASEGHPPNIEQAARTLTPLGVTVLGTESAPDNVEQWPVTDATPASTSSHLPFRDGSFDVIVNRHSSYWPGEITRTLVPGGTFLTQQRGELSGGETFLTLFGRKADPRPDSTRRSRSGSLQREAFEIVDSTEASTPIRFFDIGASSTTCEQCPGSSRDST